MQWISHICKPSEAGFIILFYSLWSIWGQRSGSTLAQVKAFCLMSTSHYLNQCCSITCTMVQFHKGCSWTLNKCSKYTFVKWQAGANGFKSLGATYLILSMQFSTYNTKQIELAHWGQYKITAYLQMTFSNTFSWKQFVIFWLGFPCSLSTISYHWFRK